MLLGKGSNGASGAGKKDIKLDKKTTIAIVAVVVILVGVFFSYKTFMGGGAPAPSDMVGIAPAGADASAGSASPAPAADPNAAAASGTPSAPAASPTPGPSAAPAAASTPAPTPSPAPAAAPASPAPAKPTGKMAQLKVFGSVTVNYPDTWKISPSMGNQAAVFTNGSAFFEVHAPDPKAQTAKAIAQSEVKSSGGSVTAQGAGKISGNDAYWMAVSRGGKTMRIVGVDAPTRVLLIEYVNKGSFAAYRDVLTKIQNGITF